MDNNRNSRISIGLLMVGVLLLIPPYYKIFGVNMLYLYSIVMVLACFVMSNLKIKMRWQGKFRLTYYLAFLLYSSIMICINEGVLYGIANLTTSVGIIYIVSISIRHRNDFIKFLDIMIFGCFILSILGILEEVLKFNFISLLAPAGVTFFNETRFGILRIQVIYGQPIVYGYLMVLFSGLILYRISTTHNAMKYWLVYILCGINVLFTFSRAPLFAYIVIQFVLLRKLKYISFSRKGVKWLAPIGLIAVMAMLFSSGFRDVLLSIYNSFAIIFSNESISNGAYAGYGNRLDLFTWVIPAMNRHYLFGNGSVPFSHVTNQWGAVKTSIENEYLNCLYYYGVVGLLLMIISYCDIVRKLRKRSRVAFMDEAISFNYIIFVTLLVYYLVIISAGQSAARCMSVTIIGLGVAYNKLLNNMGTEVVST